MMGSLEDLDFACLVENKPEHNVEEVNSVRVVAPTIFEKIKSLKANNAQGDCIENVEVEEKSWVDSDYLGLEINSKYKEIKLLERENSFESIRKRWEELASSLTQRGTNFLCKGCRHHCQFRSQTACLAEENSKAKNDFPIPSSSVNIITIKEARKFCECNKDAIEQLMNVISSNSVNELLTTGVNTEEPERKSIGVQYEEPDEKDKGANPVTPSVPEKSRSKRVSLSTRKSSISRIPRPIGSPSAKATPKASRILETSPRPKSDSSAAHFKLKDLRKGNDELRGTEKNEININLCVNSKQLQHPSDDLQSALEIANDAMLHRKNTSDYDVGASLNVILTEWFCVAKKKNALPENVSLYLDTFRKYSHQLFKYIVNLPDENGVTVLHYATSYENFEVVSLLLDTKVCEPNKPNKAGYNSIMIASLANLHTEREMDIVRKLFTLGDVNIKAAQDGQTALMLASAHGRYDSTKLLVECGADINIQDEDGSTALMYAAEHGHVDIVQFLLAQSDCDPDLRDNEGSSVLNVALEAGQKDIAVLLYAHMHFTNKYQEDGLSSPYEKPVLAKRSVSAIVRRQSKSPGKKSNRKSLNLAKKQQSSIN